MKNITSKEARDIATTINKKHEAEQDEEQLEKVLELIQDCANKGEFVLRLYNEILRPNVKLEILNRGFFIQETYDGINETHTIIKF